MEVGPLLSPEEQRIFYCPQFEILHFIINIIIRRRRVRRTYYLSTASNYVKFVGPNPKVMRSHHICKY